MNAVKSFLLDAIMSVAVVGLLAALTIVIIPVALYRWWMEPAQDIF